MDSTSVLSMLAKARVSEIMSTQNENIAFFQHFSRNVPTNSRFAKIKGDQNVGDKIAKARQEKDQGNVFFKAGDLRKALEHYHRVVFKFLYKFF